MPIWGTLPEDEVKQKSQRAHGLNTYKQALGFLKRLDRQLSGAGRAGHSPKFIPAAIAHFESNNSLLKNMAWCDDDANHWGQAARITGGWDYYDRHAGPPRFAPLQNFSSKMKTFQKILLFVFGSLSLLIGIAITIGMLVGLTTHSDISLDYRSIIAIFALPAWFYIGWKWIRQATQISRWKMCERCT